MATFRRFYGAGPGHLLAMLVCFATAGYAIHSLFANARPWSVLLWLAGAIVVHDFLVLPIYTGLFWLARRVGAVRGSRRRVTVIYHVVAPAALSALLLVTWLPLILQLSERAYRPTTGMTQEPYLERWLALTAALFATSAVLYAARAARSRRS